MASTSTTSAHPPPPTSNKLDATQRARAMRSSRKLGAVLGTTPFLLESCGSTVPVKLHHASKRDPDSHPRTVLPHLKKHHRHHHRGYSVFDEAARVSSESLPALLPSRSYSSSKESLLSTSDSTEESSFAPLMLAVRSTEPGSSSSNSRPFILLNSTTTHPSSSDHRLAAAVLPPRSASFEVPSTPTTPIEMSRMEVRRRKMARVVRTLGENVPPELVFHQSNSDSPKKSPVPESRTSQRKLTNPKTKGTRRRSASVGSGTQWQRLLELPAPVFSSSSRAPEDQRWVGVWNRRNIAQVQRELRTLRGR